MSEGDDIGKLVAGLRGSRVKKKKKTPTLDGEDFCVESDMSSPRRSTKTTVEAASSTKAPGPRRKNSATRVRVTTSTRRQHRQQVLEMGFHTSTKSKRIQKDDLKEMFGQEFSAVVEQDDDELGRASVRGTNNGRKPGVRELHRSFGIRVGGSPGLNRIFSGVVGIAPTKLILTSIRRRVPHCRQKELYARKSANWVKRSNKLAGLAAGWVIRRLAVARVLGAGKFF